MHDFLLFFAEAILIQQLFPFDWITQNQLPKQRHPGLVTGDVWGAVLNSCMVSLFLHTAGGTLNGLLSLSDF